MQLLTLGPDIKKLPKCPHCEKDIKTVAYAELHGNRFGKQYLYYCPSCSKTLGVSNRKGFWMG